MLDGVAELDMIAKPREELFLGLAVEATAAGQRSEPTPHCGAVGATDYPFVDCSHDQVRGDPFDIPGALPIGWRHEFSIAADEVEYGPELLSARTAPKICS